LTGKAAAGVAALGIVMSAIEEKQDGLTIRPTNAENTV